MIRSRAYLLPAHVCQVQEEHKILVHILLQLLEQLLMMLGRLRHLADLLLVAAGSDSPVQAEER